MKSTSRRKVPKRKLRRPRAAAKPRARRSRRPPGESGRGKYFRIAVRAKKGFEAFRTQDVGAPGHVQRLAGRRADGSWDTITWLVAKTDAHVQGGRLIADSKGARELLRELGVPPVHVRGDNFAVSAQRDHSEPIGPTPAVQYETMRKARAARSAQTRRRITPGFILQK